MGIAQSDRKLTVRKNESPFCSSEMCICAIVAPPTKEWEHKILMRLTMDVSFLTSEWYLKTNKLLLFTEHFISAFHCQWKKDKLHTVLYINLWANSEFERKMINLRQTVVKSQYIIFRQYTFMYPVTYFQNIIWHFSWKLMCNLLFLKGGCYIVHQWKTNALQLNTEMIAILISDTHCWMVTPYYDAFHFHVCFAILVCYAVLHVTWIIIRNTYL